MRASVKMVCAPLPRSARIRLSGDRHGSVPRRHRATIWVGDGLEEAFLQIERQLRRRVLPRGRVERFDSLARRGLEEVRETVGAVVDQLRAPGNSAEDAVQARRRCEVGSGCSERGAEADAGLRVDCRDRALVADADAESLLGAAPLTIGCVWRRKPRRLLYRYLAPRF